MYSYLVVQVFLETLKQWTRGVDAEPRGQCDVPEHKPEINISKLN